MGSTTHFLLVTIDGPRMTIRAIGESPDGRLLDIRRLTPTGDVLQGPIVLLSPS